MSPWAAFAAAYEGLNAPDTNTRCRYLARIAEIWERGPGDLRRAIGAYAQALHLDPTADDFRGELMRLTRDDAAYDAFVGIYKSLLSLSALGPAVSVKLNRELSEIQFERGDERAGAAALSALLVLQPDDLEALEALEGLYRRQDDATALAGVLQRILRVLEARLEARLEDQLEADRDASPDDRPEGRHALLKAWRDRAFELAMLFEQTLGRPYEAVDLLERDVLLAAGHEVAAGDDERSDFQGATLRRLEGLSRLYAHLSSWTKLVDVLCRHAVLLSDQPKAKAIWLRAATVQVDEIGDVQGAVETLDKVLEIWPKDPAVMALFDRVLTSGGRFERLVELLSARADVASDASERSKILTRRAQILEERLGRAAEAATSLAALGQAALSGNAADALFRNLKAAGQTEEALAHLEQRLAAAEEPSTAQYEDNIGVRANLLIEAGKLLLSDLKRPEEAIKRGREALELDPQRQDAFDLLSDALGGLGDVDGLVALKRQESEAYSAAADRGARASLALVAAGRALENIGKDADAETCYRSALLKNPDNVEALQAVGMMLLGRLGVRRTEPDGAGRGGDTPSGSVPSVPDEANKALRDEVVAVFGQLADLVPRRADKAEAMTLAACARYASKKDWPEVHRNLEAALKVAPEHLPAMDALADFAERAGQYDIAARWLENALRRAGTRNRDTLNYTVRLARVVEAKGNLDGAFDRWFQAEKLSSVVANLSPDVSFEIWGRLSRNRFLTGRWRECQSWGQTLATEVSGRLHAHRDSAGDDDAGGFSGPDGAGQAVLDGLRCAAGASLKLDALSAAKDLVNLALELSPHDPPVLKVAIDVDIQGRYWGEAAAHLQTLVDALSADQRTTPDAIAQALEQRGDVMSRLANDADSRRDARACYQRAVDLFEGAEADIAPQSALEKLSHLAAQDGDWRVAASASLKLADHMDKGAARCGHMLEAARYLGRAEAWESAVEILEDLVVDAPEQDEVVTALVQALEKSGQSERVPGVLATYLPQMDRLGEDVPVEKRQVRAGLWFRLGSLAKEAANARAALEMAVAVYPDAVEARLRLASLLEQNCTTAESLDVAVQNRQEILRRRPTDGPSLQFLEDVYRRRGTPEDLRVLSGYGPVWP